MPETESSLPHVGTYMSKHDPADIFTVAEQFRNAGKWMYLAPELAPRVGFIFDAPMPSIVTSAFALELYLKCLLTIEGAKFGNIHDLWDLFGKLSQARKRKIRAYFAKNSTNLKKYVVGTYKQAGMKAPIITFAFALKASRKAFPNMRYVFESGLRTGTGWLADAILEGTRRTILDINPHWEHARQVSPRPVLGVEPRRPTAQ
jgi:HEPN domain-containing protein